MLLRSVSGFIYVSEEVSKIDNVTQLCNNVITITYSGVVTDTII